MWKKWKKRVCSFRYGGSIKVNDTFQNAGTRSIWIVEKIDTLEGRIYFCSFGRDKSHDDRPEWLFRFCFRPIFVDQATRLELSQEEPEWLSKDILTIDEGVDL